MGFGVSGMGFRVSSKVIRRFQVWGLGLRVDGLGCGSGFGFRD